MKSAQLISFQLFLEIPKKLFYIIAGLDRTEWGNGVVEWWRNGIHSKHSQSSLTWPRKLGFQL
jgi:hypothetical protein